MMKNTGEKKRYRSHFAAHCVFPSTGNNMEYSSSCTVVWEEAFQFGAFQLFLMIYKCLFSGQSLILNLGSPRCNSKLTCLPCRKEVLRGFPRGVPTL